MSFSIYQEKYPIDKFVTLSREFFPKVMMGNSVYDQPMFVFDFKGNDLLVLWTKNDMVCHVWLVEHGNVAKFGSGGTDLSRELETMLMSAPYFREQKAVLIRNHLDTRQLYEDGNLTGNRADWAFMIALFGQFLGGETYDQSIFPHQSFGPVTVFYTDSTIYNARVSQAAH